MKVDAAATAAMVSSFIVFIVKVLQCPRNRAIELWRRNHRSEGEYAPFASWAGDGDIAGMYIKRLGADKEMKVWAGGGIRASRLGEETIALKFCSNVLKI